MADKATTDLAQQLLDNQAREIEQKKQEVELENQKERNRFEFAKMALKVESENLEKNREHKRKQSVSNKVFVSVILLLVLGFLGYALNSRHDEAALEIIKAAVFVAGGGAGGYALGDRKSVV